MENNFLTAAIEKIASLAVQANENTRPRLMKVDGKDCLVHDSGAVDEIYNLPPAPETQRLNSLEELVAHIKDEGDFLRDGSPIYVSATSPTAVLVTTRPSEKLRMARKALYYAKAADVPGFSGAKWTLEQARIALRSQFQRSGDGEDDADYILNLLANVTTDHQEANTDNGVTQQVTVRKGVGLSEQVQVRPIVTLAPYRTFQEVQQPASEFVFRIDPDGRSIQLEEADGGMWRLAARETVRDYLKKELAAEVEAGSVIITL